MTKYYFISYQCFKNNRKTEHIGSNVMKVTNFSIKDISSFLESRVGADKGTLVLLCLKDLSKEEYDMLSGEDDETEKSQ